MVESAPIEPEIPEPQAANVEIQPPVHDDNSTPDGKCSIETQTTMTGADIDELLKRHDKMEKDAIHVNEELYKLRDQLKATDEISRENLEKDDERVKYYTGLPTFTLLWAIYNLVEPHISVNHRSLLTKFQQMMLVFMRLRLNLSEMDLAYRFGVSQGTISHTFNAVLDNLYGRLGNLITWPDRESLRETMPMTFRKHFGLKVVSIIDCFEIFIDRPEHRHGRSINTITRSSS